MSKYNTPTQNKDRIGSPIKTPFYSREEDAKDPRKTHDREAFFVDQEEADKHEVYEPGGWTRRLLTGWFWRTPDDLTMIYGPFDKMDDAIADAREQA